MKKLKKTTAFIIILIFLISKGSFSESIKVNLNGKDLLLPEEPFIIEGRTMVPLRAAFEAFGAKIEWDNSSRQVTGILRDKIIKLTIDNNIGNVNGQDVLLDVPGTIKNDITFVPVRFIGESLGAHVTWDSENRTVLINLKLKRYSVNRVVDGDTIKIDYNGKEESVRLIGIDTPESVHSNKEKNTKEGLIASQFTKDKLEGKDVFLEFDVQERDQYGRLLAYVWIDGEMFNKVLLREGYAQVATFPPNVKYQDDFIKLQNHAIENNIGFWGK